MGSPIYDYPSFNTAALVPTTDANTGLKTAGTNSCMACQRKKADASATGAINGVWCSAAWNYEYTLLLLANQYPLVVVGTSSAVLTFAADGGVAAVGLTGDQGACCYVSETMTPIHNAASLTGVVGTINLLNKWICPAKFTNNYGLATVKISLTDATTADQL